jgi:predicted transcriptional regulator YdeE
MTYSIKIESLPPKEFAVIKGYGRLYDPGISPDANPDNDTWNIIRRRIDDGSIMRLKKAAGSETIYMLFCNTCVRSDDEKCYICGYDIACEYIRGTGGVNDNVIAGEFEIVRLKSNEYAVFYCEFDNGAALPDAHEKTDALFWNEWLKANPYSSAIDDPANWNGNGYAAMELYLPFDPDAAKFIAQMWYPIIKK